MGANAQTTVPLFVSGQVLTAAQQNNSAGTGVPVFATTTTRDAAFGGSNKVLAEGQLCYIEASDVVQYYTGSAWATVGPTSVGLVLVSATTIGSAVTSVTVTGAFSSTYENYLITINGGVASADTSLALKLGSTTTGYYAAASRVNFAGGNFTANDNNAAAFTFAGLISTNALNLNAVLQSPNLAKATVLNSSAVLPKSSGYGQSCNGVLENTTQYTDFTLTPASGTITGGIIRVYGYLNS